MFVIRNSFRTVHQAFYRAGRTSKYTTTFTFYTHLLFKNILLHLKLQSFLSARRGSPIALPIALRSSTSTEPAAVLIHHQTAGDMTTWVSATPHPGKTSISTYVQAQSSVSVHMTRVGPLQLRLIINSQEVFVPRSATHPGLAKPHHSCKEELPFARPHPALRGHLDAAGPVAYPHPTACKDLGLLSVETAKNHTDGRVFLFLLHLCDAAASHWTNGADRLRSETGYITGFFCRVKQQGLTNVTGANGQKDLGITAGLTWCCNDMGNEL